ncbi:MAG: glycosyl hydrolase family 18 protein [Salibacteraceae bacterium]
MNLCRLLSMCCVLLAWFSTTCFAQNQTDSLANSKAGQELDEAGQKVNQWFENFIYRAAGYGPDTSIEQSQSVHPGTGLSFRAQQVQSFQKLTRQQDLDWTGYHNLNLQRRYNRNDTLQLTYKVLGFHPYWMGDAWQVYDFSLLSHLAYFSYELQSDGNYASVHDWNSTKMIDSAHQANPDCKVLLTVNSFNSNTNQEFLNSPNAQDRLIQNLSTLLKGRNGDGVVIDMENVPEAEGQAFTLFIKKLYLALKDSNQTWEVAVTLPALPKPQYDIVSLWSYTDLFLIMGYDFYGSFSTVTGPISPLYKGQEWWSSLDQSAQQYQEKLPDLSKIVMGLPYYGAEWYTEGSQISDTVVSPDGFIGNPTYRNITEQEEQGGTIDSASYSKYYNYKTSDGRTAQLWFDDSSTLGAKYDWVKARNFGGIGIWALGYDNGKNQLWELLETEFTGVQDTSINKPLPPDTSDTAGFSWKAVLEAVLPVIANNVSLQQIVKFVVSVVLIFAAILWFMALLGGELAKVLTNWVKKLFYFYLLLLLLLAVLRLLSLLEPNALWWLLGFMTGAFITILLVRSYLNTRPLP